MGLIDEGLFNYDIATATFEDQGHALLNGDAAMAVQVNALFGQLQAKADNETLDETIGFFPISPSGNEIGRASCRERAEIAGGAAGVNKNEATTSEETRPE